MKRDLIFLAFVAAVVLGSSALFFTAISAAAHGSVFDVTDPDRGLIRMHHELVQP